MPPEQPELAALESGADRPVRLLQMDHFELQTYRAVPSVFMTLSADTQPHFATVAAFVSELHREIASLFRDVVLYALQPA